LRGFADVGSAHRDVNNAGIRGRCPDLLPPGGGQRGADIPRHAAVSASSIWSVSSSFTARPAWASAASTEVPASGG
jgi:hypothetical protein